jgi:50S ribosomal subunit-associated GTPase HflX
LKEHRSKRDEGGEKDEDEKAKIGRGVKMKGRGGTQREKTRRNIRAEESEIDDGREKESKNNDS